jgi:hypothetical protein
MKGGEIGLLAKRFFTNHFNKKGDIIMKNNQTKKQEAVKEQKNVDEKEIRRTWLSAYATPRNTAARVATAELMKGTRVSALMEICKAYNAQQKKGHWGEKASDIASHLRWLQEKGHVITSENENLKLSA